MIMKKFYMILAALLIGSVCFAQNVDLKLRKMNVPASGAERSAWVGSTAMDGAAALDQGLEYAVAPKAFDANLSGNITKVKFYHAYQPEVEEGETPLTNTSYTIKIYTNPTLGGAYASMGFYELSATEAYTQDFTAGTESGWQEVELTTPFAVPSGDFWVAIKANNGAAALPVGGAATAVEGQTYCQYDFTSQGASVLWVTPEFGSQGNTTLYTLALAIYVDDGAVYVPTSDFEARFFGGINGNQVTPAEASYTLTSADQSLTLLPFFANNGADDAVDGVAGGQGQDGGVPVENGEDRLGENQQQHTQQKAEDGAEAEDAQQGRGYALEFLCAKVLRHEGIARSLHGLGADRGDQCDLIAHGGSRRGDDAQTVDAGIDVEHAAGNGDALNGNGETEADDGPESLLVDAEALPPEVEAEGVPVLIEEDH